MAYCRLCGWNIPAETSLIRTDVRVGWLAGAAGLVLVLLAWRGPWGLRGALLIGLAFLWLPASKVLIGQHRLSRIQQIATRPAPTVGPPDLDGLTQSNLESDRFCMMPRPRQVKMTWLGRLYVVGVAGATVLAMWLLSIMAQAFLHPVPGVALKAAFAVVVYGALCWSCFAFFRNRIRERNLFVNGEIARGTVATRTEGTDGAYITYTFQVASGLVYQKRVFDFSKNQFEKMPLHVFYDAVDPSRNAALETSLYRMG